MDIDYIKQKALVRILDDDEALGEALKLYLELEGWRVAVYTQARRFFCRRSALGPGVHCSGRAHARDQRP